MPRRTAFHPVVIALACGATLAPACGAPMPAPVSSFSPERFFAGATEGIGTIRIIMRGRHAVRVRGSGRLEPDGTIVLTQQVDEAGKPPRQRRWSVRQVAPGRYAGTLSDATGPVTGTLAGDTLHVRFRMGGGLFADQRLTLQPDGGTVLNHMTVRKMGIVVGMLDETIRKRD